jgi:hypothetical protein
MSENSEIVEHVDDLLDSKTEESIEMKSHEKKELSEFDRDCFSLLSTVDPESGLDFAWLDIRDRLCNGEKPIDVLPAIFYYYEEKNPRMDHWLNYLLACNHFTKEEIGGPQHRQARKRLEAAVKKLMKGKAQKPGMNMHQYLYENKDTLDM